MFYIFELSGTLEPSFLRGGKGVPARAKKFLSVLSEHIVPGERSITTRRHSLSVIVDQLNTREYPSPGRDTPAGKLPRRINQTQMAMNGSSKGGGGNPFREFFSFFTQLPVSKSKTN